MTRPASTRPTPPSSALAFHALQKRQHCHEPLLTKAEIARHLGKSTKTVERYMKRGMPYSKPYPNGAVWFRVSEVDAWLGGGSQPAQVAADDAPKLLIGDRQALMRVRGVVELEADKLGPLSAARGWLHARGDEITGALERERFRGAEVDRWARRSS